MLPYEIRSKIWFVNWENKTNDDGKVGKAPIDAQTGERISWKDSANWLSYKDAIARSTNIGVVIPQAVTEERIVCIDLDDTTPDAAYNLINASKTYVEISPSGKGYHIWGMANLPVTTTNVATHVLDGVQVELFVSNHFVTITDKQVPGTPRKLGDITTLANKILDLRRKAKDTKYNTIAPIRVTSDAQRWAASCLKAAVEKVGAASKGKRNAELYSQARWIAEIDAGNPGIFGSAEIEAAFMAASDLPQFEVEATMASAFEAGRANPKPYVHPGSEEIVLCSEEEIRGKVKVDETLLDEPDEDDSEEIKNHKLAEGPDFVLNLEESNFFSQFMKYGAGISDAFEEYWFAGAAFILSVIADKIFVVNARQSMIHTNLYINILGNSTLARKSTAVNKAEDALEMILQGAKAMAVVPNEFSPEAFVEHMDQFNHTRWVKDESAGMLNSLRKDYMAGFKDTLMTMYDCKPLTRMLRTNKRKDSKTMFDIRDPYLNIIWATTQDNFASSTDSLDVQSGFMARFLHFFPNRPKKSWMPISLNPVNNNLVDTSIFDVTKRAGEIVNKIQCFQGGDPNITKLVAVEPEAEEFFTAWQEPRDRKYGESDDHRLAQIYGRLVISAVKIALLFEIGSADFNPGKATLRKKHLVEACRLVDDYFMKTAVMVYDLVGQKEERNNIVRIERVLRTHGGKFGYNDLLRNTKMLSAEMEAALATMVASESAAIKEEFIQGKRPKKWVLLLNQA